VKTGLGKRASSQTRNNAIAGWIFAIFWNLVSMPVAFLALPQAARQRGAIANIVLIFVLIFPVAGAFLLGPRHPADDCALRIRQNLF
jgi:hypothetical protein